MTDDTFDILPMHAWYISKILAGMKLLEARVAALETMLRPVEVMAADWGIPLHHCDCICATCENLRRDITAMATHWSQLIKKEE